MKKVQVGVTKATERPPTVSREYHDKVVLELNQEIKYLRDTMRKSGVAEPRYELPVDYTAPKVDLLISGQGVALSDPKHDSRINRMLRKSIDNATKKS